jgi:hypothetical protein
MLFDLRYGSAVNYIKLERTRVKSNLLWIDVVEVVLHEANATHQIRVVEVVATAPSHRSEPPSFSRDKMQENDPVEHRVPLRGETVLQLIVERTNVGSFQAGLQPSWCIVGVSGRNLRCCTSKVLTVCY